MAPLSANKSTFPSSQMSYASDVKRTQRLSQLPAMDILIQKSCRGSTLRFGQKGMGRSGLETSSHRMAHLSMANGCLLKTAIQNLKNYTNTTLWSWGLTLSAKTKK